MITLSQDDFEVEQTPTIQLDESDFESVTPAPIKPSYAEPVQTAKAERMGLVNPSGAERYTALASQQAAADKRKRERSEAVAELQYELDNGNDIDPDMMVEYGADLKFPEMEKPKVQPKAAEAKTAPESTLEVRQKQFAKNAAKADAELIAKQAELAPSVGELMLGEDSTSGDILRSVGSVASGVGNLLPSTIKGVLDLPGIKQTLGNTAAGKLVSDWAGKLEGNKAELVSEISQRGGKGAEFSQNLANMMAETAANLAVLGVSKVFSGGTKLVPNLKAAGKMAMLAFAQTPGTVAEKSKAAALMGAFALTPIPASKMPKDWMAKAVNIVENLGLSEISGKGLTSDTPWTQKIPQALLDTLFGIGAKAGGKTIKLPEPMVKPTDFAKSPTQVGMVEGKLPIPPTRIELPAKEAPNATQEGQVPEVNIGQHIEANARGIPAEAGGGNRDVGGGDVATAQGKNAEVAPEVATMPVEPSKVVEPIPDTLPVAEVKADVLPSKPLAEPAPAEAKGPGLKGGPGAAAAITAPQGIPEFFGGLTGTKNEYTKEMQKRLGWETTEQVPKKDAILIEDAHRVITDDPAAGQKVRDEIKAKPRPMTDTERIVQLHDTVVAEAALNKAMSESHDPSVLGDAKARAENSIRIEKASETLQEIFNTSQSAGGESGRSLRAIRLMMAEDYSLARMIARKRAANDGKPLTPEKIAEVKKASDEIAKNPQDVKLKKKWNDTIDRDKRDPDRWAEAMDAYLKEKKTELPRGLSDQLKSEMKNAVRLPDETARNTAILKVIDKLNGHVSIKAGDWFDAYVYTNMLSGPMSHARNVLGNLTNQLALRPMTLMANKDFRGAGTYLKKSWETVVDGSAWKMAMEAFRKGEEGKMVESIRQLPENATPMQKMKFQMEMAKRARGPANKAGRVAWKALTWTGKFMQAQDMYFGKMIEAGEKARLVQSGKSYEFADKQAKDLANKYLYRDRLVTPDRSLDMASRILEHVGLTLDQVRKIPYLGRGAKLAIPFLKTPVKIAQFNTQVSPLGFIGANKNRIAKAHYKITYNEMQKQLQQERASKEPNQEKVQELQKNIEEVDLTSAERSGKAAVGTMLSVAGALAAGMGNTIWAAPQDPKAKKLFYDAGYRPYSFRVPGTKKWIPMMYLGAGMIAFAVPAAIRDVLIDNPQTSDADFVTKMAKLGVAVPAMLLDQLPLEGLSSMMNTIQERADYSARKVIGRTVMQVVPASGALQWIKNITDPTYRKPVTVAETIEAGIPGLSDYVKALQTSEGLDAKMDIWDALSPYKIGKENEKYVPDYKDRLQILREKMQLKRELEKEK